MFMYTMYKIGCTGFSTVDHNLPALINYSKFKEKISSEFASYM